MGDSYEYSTLNPNVGSIIDFLSILLSLILIVAFIILCILFYKNWRRERLQDPTKDLLRKKRHKKHC